jgi:DNA polymerase
MSARLHEALDAALPLLKKIREGVRVPPKASASALEKLRRSARATPKPPPPAQIPEPSGPRPEPRRAERAPAQIPAPVEPPAPTGGWTLPSLRSAALACTKCPHLVATRTQVVFGVGNPDADLFFVGEAPGADEDGQGEPFVGLAGQLQTKIIRAMGFEREDVFIANVLKCRPDMPPGTSGNRRPKPAEMATCLPWLREQIALVKPRVIVALGAVASEGLLGVTSPLRDLRGRWHEFQDIPVMITYHPAYLLRNQSLSEKRKVWEDMLLVLEKLGKKITPKQRAFFTAPA